MNQAQPQDGERCIHYWHVISVARWTIHGRDFINVDAICVHCHLQMDRGGHHHPAAYVSQKKL